MGCRGCGCGEVFGGGVDEFLHKADSFIHHYSSPAAYSHLWLLEAAHIYDSGHTPGNGYHRPAKLSEGNQCFLDAPCEI